MTSPDAVPKDGKYSGGGPSTRDALPDVVPARTVNEFVYCPRLFDLDSVQGECEHSVDTVQGRAVGHGLLGDEGVERLDLATLRRVARAATRPGRPTRTVRLRLGSGSPCRSVLYPIPLKQGCTGRQSSGTTAQDARAHLGRARDPFDQGGRRGLTAISDLRAHRADVGTGADERPVSAP